MARIIYSIFKQWNRFIERLIIFFKVTKLENIRVVAEIQSFCFLGLCDKFKNLHKIWYGYCQKWANILSHIRKEVQIPPCHMPASVSTHDTLLTQNTLAGKYNSLVCRYISGHQQRYVTGFPKDHHKHISKRLPRLHGAYRDFCLLMFSSPRFSNRQCRKYVKLLKRQ